MKLSKKASQNDWIVTPAAADNTISLTDDQQKWLHTYYSKEIPEYELITKEYTIAKAYSVKLQKKFTTFPSKEKWSPPLRQLSDKERQLLIGPPSSATLLKKVQVCLPNTGRWITYSSSQFQQSARISSAYVCASSDHSKLPQLGHISMILQHRFANTTKVFALITIYGNATFDEDVAMWFTPWPPVTEMIVMSSVEDLSEPLVVAHDEENMVIWFLNYSQ